MVPDGNDVTRTPREWATRAALGYALLLAATILVALIALLMAD